MSSDCYSVTPVQTVAPFSVTVPGSKSITNRALLLAALSDLGSFDDKDLKRSAFFHYPVSDIRFRFQGFDCFPYRSRF